MADNLDKTVLIDHNIFLKPYRATDEDYVKFKTDVNEQLKSGLLFNNLSDQNSLNTLIQFYKFIRNGIYLNKAQQVSLDYKNNNGILETKPIYLTKEEYLKLKTLSGIDTQDKTIKAYQRLQSLITGNQFILKDNQINEKIFTFAMYRDYVLGLFDTFEGDFPNKADKLLKGYQKSYEEALETIEDLVTSSNPLRSGYYRMYNESPEVRQTVDAFKRALVEKAAIEENDRSEFKTMELGLMKLLQYGSLDDKLRKQILALIQQNAEGVAKVVGGADENYSIELQNLITSWGITLDKIQKPSIVNLGESIQSGWTQFSNKMGSLFTKSKQAASVSVVQSDYLKQLEKDLTTLSGEVNKILPALNPSIPEENLKLKMYEELLANLELLLDLIMNIKQASTSDNSILKTLYKNLKEALQKVIEETKELNQSSEEIAELMNPIAKSIEGLADLPADIVAPQVNIAPEEQEKINAEYNRLITEIEPIVKGMPDAQQTQLITKIEAAKNFYNSSLTEEGSNKKTFTDEFIRYMNEIKVDIASDELKEWYAVSKDAYIEKQALPSEVASQLVPKPPSELPPLQRRRLPAMPPLQRPPLPEIQEIPSGLPPLQRPRLPPLPETPLPPIGTTYSALESPASSKFNIVNPIGLSLNKSIKKQIQESIVKFLTEQASLKNVFSQLDSKLTIKELDDIIQNLPKDATGEEIDKKKANLIRIAFFIANIQENVEINDRDMSGLTREYFTKMLSYFTKSTAYQQEYLGGIIYSIKEIQKDLYSMLVDQLYALHSKPGNISTYAADTKDRNFIPIDTRGVDRILIDTILPKFKNDTEPPIYNVAYAKAAKSIYFYKVEDYLISLGDLNPTADGILQTDFTNLKTMDNDANRRNFLTSCIDYIVIKYKARINIGKKILYELLVGKDSYGSYTSVMSSTGGDINLSEENKDMDGGAPRIEPIQLEDIKNAIQKLDESRKSLRTTQEELNSWKEKFATYDKSVDITKHFKPESVLDKDTLQTIKNLSTDLDEAYQNVINARIDATHVNDEEKEKNKKDIETAEEVFTEQLKTFLVNKFAYTDSNKSETLRKFVSILKQVLPGEISIAASDVSAMSKQLLSIKDFINKINEASLTEDYYTATELVSIYEFLKDKSEELKKFNTARFNAMDKTLREVYQFILTVNKPLETKEKFKQKRIEFESLFDGSENIGDDQRFKDLITSENKKSIKGLLPTIKDIKRLMETDIDYFTSLFQQKATSIVKQQELERQKQELQVRRAQPGPFAFFGPQPPQKGGAEIDTETRKKLKYYFGIDDPVEGYETYKNVHLYLDVLNKLVDSYKFSLTTITDPAAALALSGDKSLFNMIYEKYLKSSEDETKGSYIASQELSTALDTNNLVPRKVLRVTLRDKVIILFTTLFMRLITLSIVEFMIEKGILKNLKYTMLAYLGFFSIIFIAFTALINLDLYRLRIVFNYLNFHANSDKVYSYLLLLWAFGGIIYYIITNVNLDITVTNTSEDVKARLIYRIQVLSLIIWLFLILMVFIF